MLSNKGFTLLEILIVLTISVIILLISIPFNSSTVEKRQEEQFIETLKVDILYLQNLAMNSSEFVRLMFYEDKYIIFESTNAIRTKYYPSEWEIKDDVIRPLSFYNNGTVRQPGSMTIKMNHSKFKYTFPFGKGRGYVEKQ